MQGNLKPIQILLICYCRFLQEYEVLDYFWYSLSDEEFSNKWDALGWPLRMHKTLEETEVVLIAETERFLKIHLEEEAEHQDKILLITDKVAQLTKRSDLDKVRFLLVSELFRIRERRK